MDLKITLILRKGRFLLILFCKCVLIVRDKLPRYGRVINNSYYTVYGILYGVCKIHKSLIDNCPPFWSILSAIKTPSYNIAKHLVPILEPITTNQFTIKNSFGFAKEVIEQDSGLFMASLDVESLFTNIPLEETINISCDSLFGSEAEISYFSRNNFEKLLRTALQNNFFNFDGKIYKQTDGVAMGSP